MWFARFHSYWVNWVTLYVFTLLEYRKAVFFKAKRKLPYKLRVQTFVIIGYYRDVLFSLLVKGATSGKAWKVRLSYKVNLV